MLITKGSISDQDRRFGASYSLSDLPGIKNDDLEYDQLEFADQYGKNLCTVYAAMGALSESAGYTFPLHERKKLVQLAIQSGLDPDVGWYLHKAVDLVRRRYNTHKQGKIHSYRIRNGSKDFWELLEKGYRLQSGFWGNSAYTRDKNDGVLDGNDFDDPTYYHSISLKKWRVIDNYAKNQASNIYQVRDLAGLIENKVFFTWSYVFVNEQIFEDVSVGDMFWKAISQAKNRGVIQGYINGSFRPNENVTRGELVAILNRLELLHPKK